MKCIALQQYCKSMMSLHCTGSRHFVGASTISFRPFSAFGHVLSVSLSVLSVCSHWTPWVSGPKGLMDGSFLGLRGFCGHGANCPASSNRQTESNLSLSWCHYVSLFEIRILVISKHEPNMLCKLFQNGPQHCKVIECDFKLQ